MADFIKKHFDTLLILAMVLFGIVLAAIVCAPLIFFAVKGDTDFSRFYSKRALIFSLGNAGLLTFISLALALFLGAGVMDESAGSAIIWLMKIALAFGLLYGFSFSYLAIYLISRLTAKS